MEGHAHLRNQIAAEAADWFARLQEPAQQPALREDFALWLLSSPTHVDEFLAITRVWGDLDLASGDIYSVESLVAAARTDPDNTNVVPLDESRPVGFHTASPQPAAAPPMRRPRAVLRTAACVAVLALGGLAFFAMHTWRGPSHIRTAIGEQRALTLADGSIVHLNTNSDVTVDIGPRARHIHLLSGEARFDVAQDRSRPFFVDTPQATVRAVGTIFNVRAADTATAVTVVEGRVEVVAHTDTLDGYDSQGGQSVTPASTQEQRLPHRSTLLGEGERAAVTAAGRIVPNVGPPVESVLAWSDQRLVFREQSLVDVLAEFNRYQKHPIRIADPSLAALTISGTFTTNDTASLLQYLEKYHDVILEDTPDGGRLLRLGRSRDASKL
jgi:transmembrane sensor